MSNPKITQLARVVSILTCSFVLSCGLAYGDSSEVTADFTKVVDSLKGAGFTSVNKISFADGAYKAEGINDEGLHVTAYIEPASGDIIREKNYAPLKNISAIEKLANNLEKKYYRHVYDVRLSDDLTTYIIKVKNSENKLVGIKVNNGTIISDSILY